MNLPDPDWKPVSTAPRNTWVEIGQFPRTTNSVPRIGITVGDPSVSWPDATHWREIDPEVVAILERRHGLEVAA